MTTKLFEQAAAAIELATKGQAATDTVSMNVGDLCVILGLLRSLSSQSLSLSEARAENDRKDAEIERLKKLSDRYGVALMMIRAGCSDPARFAGNILDDRQPVNVELDEEDFDENHR